MRVLVANAGSSSLKLSLLDGDDTVLWRRELDAPRSVVEPAAVAQALAELPEPPEAVGHRIVHGGERFRSAVRLDSEVLSALHDLTRPGAPSPAQVIGSRRGRLARAT